MALNKDIDITHLPIGDLRPDPANPRRISDEELESLTRAIREFGFVDPVIARRENKMVIGGHQRLLAARKLGLKKVPVVLVDLTEDQAHLLNLALNRISGTWDQELLAHLLADLDAVPDVDLSLTGFSDDELQKHLKSLDSREKRERLETFDLDEALEAATSSPASHTGDVWLLGDHRLMCGDSIDSGDVGRFAVPRDRPGIRIDETWDAIGMRATGSHDVYFEDVPVEESDLLSRRSITGGGSAAKPRIEDARTGQGGAWFPLLVGAANLGVAEAARDYAIRFARERQPTGAPAPIAQIPSVRERIGRMESMLMNARTVLLATTEDWDEHPDERASMGPAVANAKIYAVNGAIEVVEQAMRVVGGVALLRSEPLERYLRDVRSGLANPPIEARGLEAIAASVLDGSNEG